MIQITLTFSTIAEAVRVLGSLPGVDGAFATVKDAPSTPLPTIEEAPSKAAGKPKAAAPAAPAPSPRTAAAAEAAAPAPSTTPAAPAKPTEAPAAATSAAEIPYTDLQKAVAKLHGLDKTAALPIAKTFGFDTFMPLKDPEHAGKRAEVLAAVNAKIAEIQGA